ncbi:MAG TPA: hypothetical protein VKR42_09575, partial [Ktedonobacteraceae bacterium]|nr:hypothetical protein [Ktedonobacteraceae bacterium]
WMLADRDQFLKALGIKKSQQETDLYTRAKKVEAYHDPKAVIAGVIQQTYPDKPQQWGRIRGQLYADLAPMIRLSQLKDVPSYQQFVSDLTGTFKALNIIYQEL